MDNFVRNNRDDFDLQLPPEGHEARFMKKLNAHSAIPSKRNRLIPAAASVLLITAISVSAFFYFTYKDQHSGHKDSPLSDLAIYYDLRLQHCIQAIKDSEIEGEDKIKILEELTQSHFTEPEFSEISEEEFITEYYERKLNRLSFLMARIENVNQLKKQ